MHRLPDRVAHASTLGLLAAGASLLVFVGAFLLREAWPALAGADLGALLLAPWEPLGDPARYGLRHAWVSTLLVTAVALVAAVPLGLAIGLFLSDVAPPPVRATLQPCVELLAGVPSVVYGFIGYVTLVRWLEESQGMAAGECVLAAGAALAAMVLPFVAATSAEAFRAELREVRESGYALGVSRWCVVRRVVAPAAASGVLAAVALGFARAVGETFAVMMLAGNSTEVPASLTDRAQPLTALVATELGEAGVRSPKYHALYAAAVALMVVVALVNVAIWALRRRVIARAA